jgi:hypothetical protein
MSYNHLCPEKRYYIEIELKPFEVGLTKQLLCVVDPNAGRIGELLIRRSNYKFREIQ